MSNVAAGKDTDDEGEKLNDVEKALNKLNIKTRDSLKEWRNFEDIIDEVAEKWKNFTSTEQSQIATAIAGTRQQEIFRSMMENWEEVERLTKVASSSTGTASEKMEVYLDSVEAKTNELKTTWENFVMSLGQSESWKDVLDSLIWMLNNMPIMIGYLTTIGGILLTFKIPTLVENIKNLGLSFIDLKNNLMSVTTTAAGYELTMKKSTVTLINRIVAEKGFTLELKKTLIATQLEKAGVDADTIAKVTNTIATKGLTAATISLTSALQIATLAITAIVAIVTIAVNAYKNYKQEQYDTAKATKEAADAIKEEKDQISYIKDKYNEIINSTQTATEKKEKLKSLQEELNGIYKGEEGAINLVNGAYDEQISKLEKLENLKSNKELSTLQSESSNNQDILNDWTKNVINGYDRIDSDILGKMMLYGKETNTSIGRSASGNLVIDSTKGNLIEFRNKMLELQEQYNKEGQTHLAAQIGNILSGSDGFLGIGSKSINEDADSAQPAYDNESRRELLEFQKKNQAEYQEYQEFLQKKEDLKQKFENTSLMTEKEKILKQYDDLLNEYADSQNKLFNATGYDQKLLDGLLGEKGWLGLYQLSDQEDDYLQKKYSDWDKLGKGAIELQSIMNQAKKDISESGMLSEDSQSKIFELYSLITSNEDLENSLLPSFIKYLEQLGIEVPKAVKNIKAIKDIQNYGSESGEAQKSIDSKRQTYNNGKISTEGLNPTIKSIYDAGLEALKNGEKEFHISKRCCR